MKLKVIGLFYLTINIGIFVSAQISKDIDVPCQEMPNLIQNYKADFQQLFSFYSPNVGRGTFVKNNVDIKGGSVEKLQRLLVCNNQYLKKLNDLNFDGLSQECKVDYILLQRNIVDKNREIEECLKSYDRLKDIFPFEDVIYNVGKIRRRGGSFSSEKIAYQYDSLSKKFSTFDSILNKKEYSLTDLKVSEAKINDLISTLVWVDNFYKGYDPTYTWWTKGSNIKLQESLQKYKTHILEKEKKYAFNDGSNIVGVPIGRDALLQQLEFEMIPYTPKELISFANKEFAWCDAEMLKASKQMGFSSDWKSAVEKVKNSYVPVGQQPNLINKLYDESIDFVKKHDMISIPPLAEETWGMDMMSPERQKVNPFFTGGNEITISYPTDEMSESDKLMSMRGNNPHFSRSTVFHELIPGHNLEFYAMRRNRTYRDFSTPFWIEGWSLYWELLMWNEGFPTSAEDKIGMLFWRMTRCARIIFSLNYHLGKWTPQQCIDYLVDRVDYERANAEGEVRRSFEGSYSPLYQVGYLVGGQQLMALKNDMIERKKISLKQFNDNILKLNAMPIEMIKAIMEGDKLTRNYKSHWRFYDNSLD